MPSQTTPPGQLPQGQTVPIQDQLVPESRQTQTQRRVPRAPHERDESADSQAAAEPSARAVGKLAHDDLAQGRRDTDKGPVMDAVYDKVQGDTGGAAPVENVKPTAARASR
jgi:hypothetical protein